MLRFNKIDKSQAVMDRALKAKLKSAGLYDYFCKLLKRIYKEGMTEQQLAGQSTLILTSLISFIQMSKGVVITKTVRTLVLALSLKKKQIFALGFKRVGTYTNLLLSLSAASVCFGDIYLHFGDVVVVIVTA